MKWAERPTCHPPSNPVFKIGGSFEWETRNGRRVCSYCGSIHPEDLLTLLLLTLLAKGDAILEVADWKYGFPHKVYVQGDAWAKFYLAHLADDGIDDEAFDAIVKGLAPTGLKFTRGPKGVGWARIPEEG